MALFFWASPEEADAGFVTQVRFRPQKSLRQGKQTLARL
jgi:hypothetical protein